MACRVTCFRMLIALQFTLSLSIISHQTGDKAKAFQAGDVMLGGLFPVHSYCQNSSQGHCGDLRSQDIVYFTQAMIYAIDQANNNSNILPGISLGFEILDYCSKDVVALEEASNFLPPCSSPFSGGPPVVGVVGPYSSSVALQVSNLFGLFKVPHISYGATSPLLSDKKRFKYFVRTVPSDEVRARAIVDVLLNNGTKYVSVIYSDDEFGREGSKYFSKEAQKRGICIDTAKELPQGDTTSTSDEIKKFVREKLNTIVVVLFCSKTDIKFLFNTVKILGKQNYFQWLVGGDSSEMSVYLTGNEDMANHIVVCSPQNEKLANFENRRRYTGKDVNRNPWISEVLRENNMTNFTFEELFSRDAYIQSVLNSVYTFTNVLDKIYKIFCKNNSEPVSCLQQKSQDGKLVLAMILSGNFVTPNGRTIEFDKNGDISAGYDLLKPDKDVWDRWSIMRLGRWGPSLNGSGPSMLMLFKDTQILPRASCSESCGPGEIKIPSSLCCWRCVSCNTNEITSRHQTECMPCIQGLMPDINKTKCQQQPVVDVDPSPGFILFTVCFSGIGLTCTLITLLIYTRLRAHPVIKASSRGLSCVLLVGIMITYGESFWNLLTPDSRICSLKGYICLGHVTCYAAIFSKTLRVNRLFNSSLRKTMNPTFVSTRSQLALIAIVLGIAVAFATLWGIFTYHDNVFKIYTPEEVVVQCRISVMNAVITNSFYLTLLALCAVYTFKSRKLPKQFRETKASALAIYLAATIHLVVLLIVCTMDQQNLLMGRTSTLSHPLAASAVLLPICSPKIYNVVFREERKLVCYLTKSKRLLKNSRNRDEAIGAHASLRKSMSTPNLLRRRADTKTHRQLEVLTDGLIGNHAVSLVALYEDSRSCATSTDTLSINRCFSGNDRNRRGENRDFDPSYTVKELSNSVYSTWL